MEMEFKTKNGFAYTVSEGGMDDWELLEALGELDEGKTHKLPAVGALLLGAEQYAALKEFNRGEDGRVKASVMVEEISSILAQMGKN